MGSSCWIPKRSKCSPRPDRLRGRSPGGCRPLPALEGRQNGEIQGLVHRSDPDRDNHERHRLMRRCECHGHAVDERQYAKPVLQGDQRQQRHRSVGASVRPARSASSRRKARGRGNRNPTVPSRRCTHCTVPGFSDEVEGAGSSVSQPGGMRRPAISGNVPKSHPAFMPATNAPHTICTARSAPTISSPRRADGLVGRWLSPPARGEQDRKVASEPTEKPRMVVARTRWTASR